MQSINTAPTPGLWWCLPRVRGGRDSKGEPGHSVPPKATSASLLQTQSRDTVLTVIVNELRELVYCAEGWGEGGGQSSFQNTEYWPHRRRGWRETYVTQAPLKSASQRYTSRPWSPDHADRKTRERNGPNGLCTTRTEPKRSSCMR